MTDTRRLLRASLDLIDVGAALRDAGTAIQSAGNSIMLLHEPPPTDVTDILADVATIIAGIAGRLAQARGTR